MLKLLRSVFYPKASFFKRFSLFIFLVLLTSSGCGGAATGINLPAPTADLEGGTTRETILCDTIAGAPAGAFVRIQNTSNTSLNAVESTLDGNGAFSVETCLKVGETATLELFDTNGNSISELQQVLRTGSETNDVCPTPTNDLTNCPL